MLTSRMGRRVHLRGRYKGQISTRQIIKLPQLQLRRQHFIPAKAQKQQKRSIVKQDIPLAGLISIIYRSHIIYLNAKLKNLGITASGFLVLMHLSQEQNVIQDDIARRFHIDKSAIARAVLKLENAGFVRCIVEPSNRRANHLTLTEKGNEIIPEIIRIDDLWEEITLAGVSEEKRSQLYLLLGGMVQNSLMIAGKYGDE